MDAEDRGEYLADPPRKTLKNALQRRKESNVFVNNVASKYDALAREVK
jgi:hypothetical protein